MYITSGFSSFDYVFLTILSDHCPMLISLCLAFLVPNLFVFFLNSQIPFYYPLIRVFFVVCLVI